MTTSKSNAAYNMLISLRDKLTHLNSVITLEAVNKLKDELGRIFTVTKTHHYEQGQKYGHLASAIPEQKYRLVIGNATWAHTVPGNPGTYSQAALGVSNSAALREQHVAEHKILQKSYNDYLGVKEAGKELILYAVGNAALAPLKKLYIGFGDLTVLEMIDHLCLKTAIKMTTAQKHEYKTMGYNNPWDPTTSITMYFTQLDCFLLPSITRRLWHCDKRGRENSGSRSTNVAEQDVHGGPDGCMGKQTRGATDMGGAPGILHQEVAGTQAVLRDDGKTIVIQRGSASCPRNSSSQGRRRIAGHVVRDATGTT